MKTVTRKMQVVACASLGFVSLLIAGCGGSESQAPNMSAEEKKATFGAAPPGEPSAKMKEMMQKYGSQGRPGGSSQTGAPPGAAPGGAPPASAAPGNQ